MEWNYNYTEWSIMKAMWKLSFPIVLTNLLQTAYQLIDTIWVGRLGGDAVAAVSVSFPIIFLIIALGGWFAIAGTILVAQYKWKNDEVMINHVTWQAILIMLFVSVILSIIWYFATPALISLMWVESQIFDASVSYLQISFVGMVFLFWFFMFQSLLRGVGNVYLPMRIVFLTVVLNAFLDPLFIMWYGPVEAMWVSGAAVATIITQSIACIWWFGLLSKWKQWFNLKLKDLKPDLPLIKKIFFLWLPSSLEQSGRALWLTVMTFLVTGFGSTVLAAYGIGMRIFSFVIIPAFGLSMATSTLVGQNIWANRIDRAVKTTYIWSLVWFVSLTIVWVVFFFLAKPIVTFFVPWEVEVIAYATTFVKILCFAFGLFGVQQVLTWSLRWAGDTLMPMMLTLVSVWMLEFPVAYILSHHTWLWETGLWLAFPISAIITTTVAILYYMNGSWKKKNITKYDRMAQQVTEESAIEEGI